MEKEYYLEKIKGKWFYDDKFLEWLRNYNKSIKNVIEESKLPYTTLKKILKKENINPLFDKNRCNALYKVDYNYFSDINTQDKAYWIGMLLGDGHLSKDGTLMFCMKDEDIVQKLKISLKSEHPITRNKYNCFMLNIRCKKINDDLLNIGFNHRKSYGVDFDRVMSFIPKKFISHFLRGLFDADGCFKVYDYDYIRTKQYHFGFTGLLKICEFFKKTFCIDSKLIQEGDITYTCRTRDPYIIKQILDYLYKDANIYINRKYDLYCREIKDKEFKSKFTYITYNGETHKVKDWAKLRNIDYNILRKRINIYKWDIGRALEYE